VSSERRRKEGRRNELELTVEFLPFCFPSPSRTRLPRASSSRQLHPKGVSLIFGRPQALWFGTTLQGRRSPHPCSRERPFPSFVPPSPSRHLHFRDFELTRLPTFISAEFGDDSWDSSDDEETSPSAPQTTTASSSSSDPSAELLQAKRRIRHLEEKLKSLEEEAREELGGLRNRVKDLSGLGSAVTEGKVEVVKEEKKVVRDDDSHYFDSYAYNGESQECVGRLGDDAEGWELIDYSSFLDFRRHVSRDRVGPPPLVLSPLTSRTLSYSVTRSCSRIPPEPSPTLSSFSPTLTSSRTLSYSTSDAELESSPSSLLEPERSTSTLSTRPMSPRRLSRTSRSTVSPTRSPSFEERSRTSSCQSRPSISSSLRSVLPP